VQEGGLIGIRHRVDRRLQFGRLPPDMRAEVILGEKEHEQLGGDFDVEHVLFVVVRRPHTEREGFRHARNVAAE
jgi:hypothetical protein